MASRRLSTSVSTRLTKNDATLDDFESSGTLARTADADLDGARKVLDDLAAVGVDLDAVTNQLEDEGVAAFEKAYDELLTSLQSKADALKAP